jgi:hypothetical protein
MSNASRVTAALDALLDSPGDRSKMARFRDIAAHVDRLVRAGVKRQAIVKTLAEHGLDLTQAQLKSYLGRWRAEAQHQVELTSTRAESQQHPQPTDATAREPAQHLSSAQPPAASDAGESEAPPRSGRSIRAIRTAEVDFAGADRWYREQRKAGKG